MSSMSQPNGSALRELPENSDLANLRLPEPPLRMAKAMLRNPEMDYRETVGRAIRRMRGLLGLSLKELAGKIERDPRQVARWEDGSERPQLDLLWAFPECRVPLVQAFAEQCESDAVQVKTVITLTA